jgi:hypothetical protein
VTLIGTVLFSVSALGQAPLDLLNRASEYPFVTENNISGQCFIILSKDFDYYKSPIVIKSADNKEIVRVEYWDSNGVTTTFKGSSYRQFDNRNAFTPWLFSDNPDYFALALECIDSMGTHYKVKLN